MKTQLLFGAAAPVIEVALGWYWLAAGHDVAGRLLVFYWWLWVAALLGTSFLVVAARMALERGFPAPAPSPRASCLWLRTLFFARLVAQIAIGYPTLAVLSLSAWLFCRLSLAIAFDGERVAAEE